VTKLQEALETISISINLILDDGMPISFGECIDELLENGIFIDIIRSGKLAAISMAEKSWPH